MKVALTDIEILCRVSTLFTARQLGEIWNSDPERTRVLARHYAEAGFLRMASAVIRSLPERKSPVFVHKPGNSFDDSLASELTAFFAKRFEGADADEVMLFMPTRKAYRMCGDDALKKGNHFGYGHDLHVTGIFLATRARGRWVYEPEPSGGRAYGQKQPDGGLFAPNGDIIAFCESVGAYRKPRLYDLCNYAEELNAPMEFW